MNARTVMRAIFLFHLILLQQVVGFLNPLTKSVGSLKHEKSLAVAPLFASIRSGAKTSEEVDFIKKALLANSLFSGMPEQQFLKMIKAFGKDQASKGENIITQGDDVLDGYVYLLAEGKCKVIIDGEEAAEPYGTIGKGTIFGELGILYDRPRAATIKVASDTATYYQILGKTFKSILNQPVANLASMKEIDEVINQVSGTRSLYEGDIILQYSPERSFLWRQFAGTLLAFNGQTTLIMMGASAAFVVLAKDLHLDLENFKEIWEIQRNLATFVLAFFVNEAFSFWRKVYNLSREVQGEIANYCLTLATNVKREGSGELTKESQAFLEEVGQYIRLYHVLMWASKAKRFAVLASPDGLKRMESRGLMTKRQLEAFESMDVPSHELYHAPIEWMIIRCNRAMEEGILTSDTATKLRLLEIASSMRVAARDISDYLAGRMPLAYVQLVQLLVDLFVLSAPAALYSSLGAESIPAVGLITLFYTGLNNMAKIFLDPLNNEEYCENSIFMDLGVLIREVNSISTEYVKAGTKIPF